MAVSLPEGRSVLDTPEPIPDLTERHESPGKQNQRIYKYAAEAQRDWANGAQENLEYAFGRHWTDEQRDILLSRGQMPVAVQATWQLVDQAVSMLTANRPAFRASAREDTDVQAASVWSNLFEWMWDKSEGQTRIRAIAMDNFVQGRGVAYAYVDPNDDYGRGEVKFRDFEPKAVFPDPSSQDPLWDDAAFVITRQILPGSRIKALWPEAWEKIKQSKEGVVMANDLPYTGSKGTHQFEVLDAGDIQEVFGSRSRYEVLERYEPVDQVHFRMYDVDLKREVILTRAEYEETLARDAYVVRTAEATHLTADPQAVEMLDAKYEQFGGTFHLRPGGMNVDAEGQPVEAPPAEVAGPETPGGIPGSTVELRPTTVAQLVAEGAIPVVDFLLRRIRVTCTVGETLLYPPTTLPTSFYPLVAFPAASNRTPYPSSEVSRVRDMQDLINKSLSLILAHAANSTNLKVFYPDGSIRDVGAMEQNWGRAGSSFIPYDPTYGVGGATPGGIVIAAPPPLPNALYQNMDRAYQLMERTLGVFSIQQGDPAGTPDTYRGTLAIDEMGQRRMKGKLDQIYTSITRLGRVMMDLAQYTYTDQKVIRLLGPSGETTTSTVNETVINYDDPTPTAKRVNDITIGEFDIKIVYGSTLPNNRWARLAVDMDMFQQGIIDDIAVLKHSEYPDAEEILARKSVYAQMRGALEQYQQQIKELQGDLQTWQREALHAKQRTELEKYKASLATISAEVEKNADLLTMTLNDATKRAQKAANEQRESGTADTAAMEEAASPETAVTPQAALPAA
jgi:hypothetical protein